MEGYPSVKKDYETMMLDTAENRQPLQQKATRLLWGGYGIKSITLQSVLVTYAKQRKANQTW